MSQAELNPIIAALKKEGINNKSCLQDMADDNEWDDYNIPKGLKKKIEAVLKGNSGASSGGGGFGGFTSNIGSNSGTVNNVRGSGMTFN